MSERWSRREFARRATGLAASLALAPAMAKAQATEQPKPPEVTDAEMTGVEKQLSKPMSDEAKKILKSSLEAQKAVREQRMKEKLPENSEPCFQYIPSPVAKR